MNKSKYLLLLFLIACIANLYLSYYILDQKIKNDSAHDAVVDECFIDGSGCGTVQTSQYATTFGVANPIYGLIAFTLLSVIFLIALIKPLLFKDYWDYIIMFVDLSMVFGTLFSIWLLFVQYVLLKATCIYCLWVDGIMITMCLVYFLAKKVIWKNSQVF